MEAEAKGRSSKWVGQVLAILGSLAIVIAMVSPASAQNDHAPNGKANGYGNNHEVSSGGDSSATGDPSANGGGANQDCGAYCPSGVGLPTARATTVDVPRAGLP